ncbi:putative DNA helicase ino80 [Tulasnella sp. 403]|nr:putative DNA helicase ino80 [Tulasnella sp. 403]
MIQPRNPSIKSEDDDARLASTDPSDSEEVWSAEHGRYVPRNSRGNRHYADLRHRNPRERSSDATRRLEQQYADPQGHSYIRHPPRDSLRADLEQRQQYNSQLAAERLERHAQPNLSQPTIRYPSQDYEGPPSPRSSHQYPQSYHHSNHGQSQWHPHGNQDYRASPHSINDDAARELEETLLTAPTPVAHSARGSPPRPSAQTPKRSRRSRSREPERDPAPIDLLERHLAGGVETISTPSKKRRLEVPIAPDNGIGNAGPSALRIPSRPGSASGKSVEAEAAEEIERALLQDDQPPVHRNEGGASRKARKSKTKVEVDAADAAAELEQQLSSPPPSHVYDHGHSRHQSGNRPYRGGDEMELERNIHHPHSHDVHQRHQASRYPQEDFHFAERPPEPPPPHRQPPHHYQYRTEEAERGWGKYPPTADPQSRTSNERERETDLQRQRQPERVEHQRQDWYQHGPSSIADVRPKEENGVRLPPHQLHHQRSLSRDPEQSQTVKLKHSWHHRPPHDRPQENGNGREAESSRDDGVRPRHHLPPPHQLAGQGPDLAPRIPYSTPSHLHLPREREPHREQAPPPIRLPPLPSLQPSYSKMKSSVTTERERTRESARDGTRPLPHLSDLPNASESLGRGNTSLTANASGGGGSRPGTSGDGAVSRPSSPPSGFENDSHHASTKVMLGKRKAGVLSASEDEGHLPVPYISHTKSESNGSLTGVRGHSPAHHATQVPGSRSSQYEVFNAPPYNNRQHHHSQSNPNIAPAPPKQSEQNTFTTSLSGRPSVSSTDSMPSLAQASWHSSNPSAPPPHHSRTAPTDVHRPPPLESSNYHPPPGRHDLVGPPHAGAPPRPPSPQHMIVYPAHTIPPLQEKPSVIPDKMVRAHRLAAVEDELVRVWTAIAREEVPKVYKLQTYGYTAKQNMYRRLSSAASGTKGALRASKRTDIGLRAKKVLKSVMDYWRRAEREDVERKRMAERETYQKLKQEEESREAQRQAKKLEFLLTQTELYSHFVGNKTKVDDSQDDDAPVDPTQLDFENTTLVKLASRKALKAAARTRKHHQKFQVAAPTTDPTASTAATESDRVEAVEKEVADLVATRMNNSSGARPLVDLDSDELNFQNPSSMKDKMDVAQPKMLKATLKDYQLKGLNWLATLYEQGINGILADEMGLGKTVQSISLLAHLAEAHNIWGPFLIVAPASTLHNWHQELSRFVPDLKAIPYWGQINDRKTLRKYWANDRHAIWTKESECHIVITSYTIMINDFKYFQAINWQFLILDEAQAIKNSSSARWQALLTLNTRNRLLLTGTPIQNSMQELWALLHFIMPSLFDSHDEFAEWFSKDVENQSENKGQGLTEHQLRRLHLILKPFMLRRVKRMVQTHLPDKVEHDVFCELSPRQRTLYRALRGNISIADLLNKAAHFGDASSARHLMNLVMQFRKVCNHPELFQRTDVLAPFAFSQFARTGSILREGNFVFCPDSARNPIEVTIPKLFYKEGGLVAVPGENLSTGSRNHWLYSRMSIWSPDWIERSLRESGSPFSFLSMLHISPSEAHELHISPTIRRLVQGASAENALVHDSSLIFDVDLAASSALSPFAINPIRVTRFLDQAQALPPLSDITQSFWTSSYLSRVNAHCYVVPASAPPMSLYCAERTFLEMQSRITNSPLDSLALYGLPAAEVDSLDATQHVSESLPGLPSPYGIVGHSSPDQLPVSTMHFPDAERLIFDSAKLARLDSLLQELKAGGHKVLIYFQMTKMIDLMEEYLVFRQYKYLRLDGDSKIEDRRDMVTDWQTRPDLFVFLLSTHAGGLGINLTAADTVIFYENDWNPSNDSQAMDRAHRIGQTKQVTVYRLITRGTIDERIVQLARVKKDVSDIVVGNKDFREVAKPTEIVSLLLDDEELKNLDRQTLDAGARRNGYGKSATISGSNGWELEGDEFFGGRPRHNDDDEAEVEQQSSAPTRSRGRGRGNGRGTGSRRGRGRASRVEAD